MHYWTSGSEAAAIKVIADAVTKKGGTWKDSPVTGYEAARAAVLSRLAGGDAPAAMVVDLGEVKALADQGVIAPIDSIDSTKGWQTFFPALVAQHASVDGKLYAVPIDIGTANWMWYSTKVMDDVGAKPPATWDEFFAVADKIKAKGYVPLAFGGQAWQEALVFRSIMIATGGKQFYRDVYTDHKVDEAGGPMMVKSFETFGKLRAYVDEGTVNRSWNDATNMVITNKAAIQIMGDWAKGEFQAAGLTPGKEYGCELAPGTHDALNIVSDTFAFPAGDKPEQIAARKLLVDVMISPETQVAFNNVKGALPPRLDVDLSSADICTKKAAVLLKDPANLAPNAELSFSSETVGAIKDLVTQFWSDPSMTPAAAAKQYADIVARN
jgi:glucose/mannose transport system substrate-binding protein